MPTSGVEEHHLQGREILSTWGISESLDLVKRAWVLHEEHPCLLVAAAVVQVLAEVGVPTPEEYDTGASRLLRVAPVPWLEPPGRPDHRAADEVRGDEVRVLPLVRGLRWRAPDAVAVEALDRLAEEVGDVRCGRRRL